VPPFFTGHRPLKWQKTRHPFAVSLKQTMGSFSNRPKKYDEACRELRSKISETGYSIQAGFLYVLNVK
jgi:hypothetical protein